MQGMQEEACQLKQAAAKLVCLAEVPFRNQDKVFSLGSVLLVASVPDFSWPATQVSTKPGIVSCT